MDVPTPTSPDDPDAPAQPKGSPWLKELCEYFAPVREEVAASGMTEDELNELIDQALQDVREGRD